LRFLPPFYCYIQPLEKENKIVSIQYLRGIAALGVVLCHYGSIIPSYPKLSLFFSSGQKGVDVFFLISGFVIIYSLIKHHYQVNQFLIFLVKRSIRIDPTYIVDILLTIALFKLLSLVPGTTIQSIPLIPGQFISNILYIAPFTGYAFYDSVFWSLCVEFQLYIFLGLLFFLSAGKIYRLIFIVIFTCLSLFQWPNGDYVLFTYAPPFAVGIGLVLYYLDRKWYYAVITALCIVFVAIAVSWLNALILVTSCLIILFVHFKSRLLNFLGDISYSLYLTHSLTLIAVAGIARKIGFHLSNSPLMWLGIEALFAILVAFIVYRLVEKPSIVLSKKIFYRRSVDKTK
jgi:exopolysaccharide production protein ExoZ